MPPTGSAMRMVFGRRAFFGYAVRPSGQTYWFSNYAQQEEPTRGEFSGRVPKLLRRSITTRLCRTHDLWPKERARHREWRTFILAGIRR